MVEKTHFLKYDYPTLQDAFLTEIPQLSESDARLYLVDPRDKKPCILELSDIFREQMVLQKAAAKRVTTIQKEMHQLLEDRMKQLSGTVHAGKSVKFLTGPQVALPSVSLHV